MSAADRLRGGRTVAASGQLSLDRDKARQKLRMFRLPDPHFYVLQFVRAANVLGAERIDFTISASEMRCKFDRDLPAELLDDIWGVAFEARTDAAARAVHYIALGIGSAQALNPAYIHVHTGEVTLRLRDDVEKVEPRDEGVGTEVHVREKYRFGHLVEFFTSIGGQLPEQSVLERLCAFSPIEVRVNGRSNRKIASSDAMNFHVAFREEHEQGFAALESVSVDGWVEVLKDGVSLNRVPISNHGRAGVGAMQSTRVQTDLSGLSLIKSDGWDQPIHEVFIPHYHAALGRWLRTVPRDDVGDQLDALAELIGYARLRGEATSPVTRELIDLLCQRPLFENALEPPGPPSLSIQEAMARYSTERFPGLKTQDGRPVLLVEPFVSGGIDGVRERMLRESVIAALSGHGRTVDVTKELERQATATRNQALWKARPTRQIGGRRYQHAVEMDSRRGVAYVPLERPDDTIGYDDGGFFVYREQKLLRHFPATRNFIAVEVDGSLGVTARFDDIVRDRGFKKLAVALCAGTMSLFAALANDLIESGKDERERPRVLDRFVTSLCTGEWCADFFAMLGYLPNSQIPIILEEEAEDIAHLTWFADPRPRTALIERLGPIAQVRSIELADGSFASLAEALADDELSLLRPLGDWRAFVAKTRQRLGLEVLSKIAIVDDIQERLLRRLRPIRDARLAVDAIMARTKFFEQPEFEYAPPGKTAAERTEETPWFVAKIALVPGGEGQVCVTTFVWQGRALAHRRFETRNGSFEAVVWCDELTPTALFNDVEADERVGSIGGYLVRKSHELLEQWWQERLAARDLGTGDELELFVELALKHAAAEPEDRVIPVLERDGANWKPGLVSQRGLRSLAARQGLVLSYTRANAAEPSLLADPSAPVVRLADGDDPEALCEVVGLRLRFVDATPVGLATRMPPRSFWKKPRRSPEIDGAAFKWSGVIGGLHCHCGLFHDERSALAADDERIDVLTATATQLQELHGIGPTIAAAIVLFRGHQRLEKPEDLLRVPGIGPGKFEDIIGSIRVGGTQKNSRFSNLVTVLVEGRQLESLDVQTPMGRFRSTIHGDAITPDPTYTFVAGGRNQVLLAAYEAAARTIRAACDRAQATGAPPKHIVTDLRTFLLHCRTEEVHRLFALGDVLSMTPLFPTLSGKWLPFEWIGSIARDGVISYAADGDREDVLRLTQHEVPTVAALMEPDFTLEPTATVWQQSEVGARGVEGDPILDTVVDLLQAARGDRVDLFDDHLADNVRWSSNLETVLCRVSNHGVEVGAHHPVAAAVASAKDLAACAFLASTVYSAINEYYREITDHDELELQARLVRIDV